MNRSDPEISDWPRVKEIFAEASDLPAHERAAYVHQAAAGNPAVEREVLRLLRLDAGAEEWLAGLRPPTEVVQSAAELHAFFPGQVLASSTSTASVGIHTTRKLSDSRLAGWEHVRERTPSTQGSSPRPSER